MAYTDAPAAAEHHHHDSEASTGSSFGVIVAVVLLVLMAILFLVYGTRFLNNTRSTTPSVNVPEQVDVNLNK